MYLFSVKDEHTKQNSLPLRVQKINKLKVTNELKKY